MQRFNTLYAVLGTTLLILMFASCGAADGVALDLDLPVDEVVTVGKHVVELAAQPVSGSPVGQYLILSADQLAQLPDADALPVCAHGAEHAEISRGGSQLVLTNAVQMDALPRSVPVAMQESQLAIAVQTDERTLACGGMLQGGVLALTCEIGLRGVQETCQLVMQKV